MLTPYLASRLRRTPYGVFHFRIVLPPHLAAVAGKKEVWRSLRTRDPEQAKLFAYLLNARFAMLKKPSLADLLTLTPDDIQQLTIHGLHVGGFKAERVELDSTTPETLQRDQEALKGLISAFGTLPASPSTATPEETAAAATEAAELAAIRRAGLSKPLDQCVRLYLDSKAGEISPASTKDYTNALAVFMRWADGATPIGFCDWDFVRGYFDFLQWLPTNYEKRRKKEFGNQDARTFVAAAQTRNERPTGVMSVQTRKQQQRVLNGFFEWTREAGLLTGPNPAAAQVKLSKSQRTKINAGRGYLPFSPDELRTMFEPERFLRFAQTPEDFFLPLLGLYTGARMNELAQARLKDLRRAGDRWFLDIQPDHTGDSETETRVKTVASVRSAPLHLDLVMLGLIAYAEELRERGAVRLFPHLPRDAKGKHTKNPSRRFAAYLVELGIKDDRRKAFPSFRTTLIRRMKAAGVAKDARMELVGHAPRDVHDGVYAGQFEDEFLATQTLDKARFDELDTVGLAVELPERLARFVAVALGTERTVRK
ncbi:site-specific integrase [Paraburkholderia sp. BCC1885]|uniref:site-specific integrase n=1 Tax=Paraburkholderia sp. BCC1885 TaxID=2562669 RepID=UPI00118212B3|nr:site-specific integrase [Paraburkholderia sp. BCC1885]